MERRGRDSARRGRKAAEPSTPFSIDRSDVWSVDSDVRRSNLYANSRKTIRVTDPSKSQRGMPTPIRTKPLSESNM